MENQKKIKYDTHKHKKRKRKHLDLLENYSLASSCCDICHCDCFNSHRSTTNSVVQQHQQQQKSAHTKLSPTHKPRSSSALNSHPSSDHKSIFAHDDNFITKKTTNSIKRSDLKRSKSVIDLSRPTESLTRHDCVILEHLLPSEHARTPKLCVTNSAVRANENSDPLEQMHEGSDLNGMKTMCKSLAQICLEEPNVYRAYEKMPTKDQRIINRMATKRSECVTAKENAWLARKYWENERLERELLKCKQIKEYKLAVNEKQFQDYILTRQRLERIAQQDNEQLQRLRQALFEKDQRASERIAALRIDRNVLLCQRRCDELRKTEAVNMHQEELLLENAYRRERDCQRLIERLKRADYMRSYILASHLRRIQYDNQLEQLLHEEHWRQTQDVEYQRREQLRDHIRQKSTRTQKFVADQQRRNTAITQTAKISANLRELVRNTVVNE